MCSKGLRVVVFVLLTTVGLIWCQDGENFPRGPIIGPPRRPMPELLNNNINGGGFMGSGFMSTARNFVSSPTGQMAMSMAKEFISRSAGGNQVLSLNLTSLLIVVLLKGLIFTTGLLGTGNWGQYGRGRSLEGSECLNDSEFVVNFHEFLFGKIPSWIELRCNCSWDSWPLKVPRTTVVSTEQSAWLPNMAPSI
jgi:hypothetical protein